MTSTFNFRIELADKDCNEKSYDIVKNGLAFSIDYLSSRTFKIEGNVIKNTKYGISKSIEGCYRCIEIRFDDDYDKQILALRNISDEEYAVEGQVDMQRDGQARLYISDSNVFKIFRICRGNGDWHMEYQGFHKICEIEVTGETGRQYEGQQGQEQQPKPQELEPQQQQQQQQQQLSKEILQQEGQQGQEQQPKPQGVQEKSEDTYERDAITDDQGRKKYKTFYYESK